MPPMVLYVNFQSIVMDWNLECWAPPARALLKNAAAGTNLKKTGKMPVSSIFNYLLREFVFFLNRPQVNFLKFYRLIWNLAPHIKCLRPKRAARSMSKNWTPYFENTRYTRGYVLCAAHIECCQKTYKCHHFVSKPLVLLQKMPPKTYRNVIILRHVFSKHDFSTWFEGLYTLIISYE